MYIINYICSNQDTISALVNSAIQQGNKQRHQTLGAKLIVIVKSMEEKIFKSKNIEFSFKLRIFLNCCLAPTFLGIINKAGLNFQFKRIKFQSPEKFQ